MLLTAWSRSVLSDNKTGPNGFLHSHSVSIILYLLLDDERAVKICNIINCRKRGFSVTMQQNTKHKIYKNKINLTLTEAIEWVGVAGLLNCFLPAPSGALSSLSSLLAAVMSDGGAGGGVSPGQIL